MMNGKSRLKGLPVSGLGVDGRGAFAAAENVRADHKKFIGIKGFAGSDDDIPPARLLIVLMPASGMSISERA